MGSGQMASNVHYHGLDRIQRRAAIRASLAMYNNNI